MQLTNNRKPGFHTVIISPVQTWYVWQCGTCRSRCRGHHHTDGVAAACALLHADSAVYTNALDRIVDPDEGMLF